MKNASIYGLKSHFQKRLLPIRDLLIRLDISPNQITLVTCFLCLIYAFCLINSSKTSLFLLFFPFFLFLRMALNALDGMVALHTKTKTAWGAMLNETCDVLSDFVLLGSFLFILPTYHLILTGLIVLSFLIEFIGLAIYQAVHFRPLQGPFGKSDRAVFLGGLGLIVFFEFSSFLTGYLILSIALGLLTIWNRLSALRQKHQI